MACPQCQSPLIVELESNPDGEEVHVAAPLADAAVAAAAAAGTNNILESSAGVVGEEVGGEVARISWIERPVSIAKDVPMEESPVGNDFIWT